MTPHKSVTRAQTLFDAARESESLQQFGLNLRDWQHEIERGGVHSRTELARRIADEPPRCRNLFSGGDIADAYLAAYAEWLADRAGIDRPNWTADEQRVADEPWFATPLRGRLLAVTPASFRQRNLFTLPDSIFHPAPGRPRVPTEQKHRKAAERQRAYRERIRALVAKARAQL